MLQVDFAIFAQECAEAILLRSCAKQNADIHQQNIFRSSVHEPLPGHARLVANRVGNAMGLESPAERNILAMDQTIEKVLSSLPLPQFVLPCAATVILAVGMMAQSRSMSVVEICFPDTVRSLL